MANLPITSLQSDTTPLSSTDYFLKIKNGLAWKVSGKTIVQSGLGKKTKVNSLGNGISIVQSIGNVFQDTVLFNTISASNGISITNNSNLINVSFSNAPFLNGNMFVANSLSDLQVVDNTITGSDITTNTLEYDSLNSNIQIVTAKAWVNFNGAAVASTVTGEIKDNISVNNGSNVGTWATVAEWDQTVLNCIYFISSATLGWKNRPVRIVSFNNKNTAVFNILNGNYQSGFTNINSTISTAAKGNTFSYYSDGIRSCYNVESILRNPPNKTYYNYPEGFYTIYFANAMADSNYAVAGNGNDPSGIGTFMVNSQTTKSCNVEAARTKPLESYDLSNISMVVFGN